MKKIYLICAASLTLASCGAQEKPITPIVGGSPVIEAPCDHVIDLPHATVAVGQHSAASKVKAGFGYVKLAWTFNGVVGSDNVYTNGKSDAPDDLIAVGCAEGLQVTEITFR